MTRTDGLRRDRDGSLVPEAFNLDGPHPHVCFGVNGGRGHGWIGQDDQGRPIPCPHCKPHTLRGRNRLPVVDELPVVPPTAAQPPSAPSPGDPPALAATAPRCAEHSTYTARTCGPCWSEVATGQRTTADVGRARLAKIAGDADGDVVDLTLTPTREYR